MFATIVADHQANGLAHLLLRATCRSPAMLDAGIVDAQAALAWSLADPGELVRLTGQTCRSDDEVLGFLNEAVTLDPCFDDGDVLPYLVACLKAHLQVLQAARAQGLVVVHVRSSAVGWTVLPGPAAAGEPSASTSRFGQALTPHGGLFQAASDSEDPGKRRHCASICRKRRGRGRILVGTEPPDRRRAR